MKIQKPNVERKKQRQFEDRKRSNLLARPVTGQLLGKRVVSVAAGYQLAIAITDEGKAYSWRVGESAKTSKPDITSRNFPQLIHSTNILNKRFASACIGGGHAVLLTEKGLVYTFGSNSFGQLGIGISPRATDKPILVESLREIPIQRIACGGDHTLALSSDRRLFAWGWNELGQLGSGDYENRYVPIEIQFPIYGDELSQPSVENESERGKQTGLAHVSSQPLEIEHIVGSKYGHSFAVSKDGRVFGFGWNEQGQLGIGDRDNRNEPTDLGLGGFSSVQGIRKLDAGYKHSAVLLENGQILVLGDNLYGQLGETVDFQLDQQMALWNASSASSINRRDSMEDFIKMIEMFDGNSSDAFFAIYDGHGGRKVANFLAKNFHKYLIQELHIGHSRALTIENIFVKTYETIDSQICKKDVYTIGSTATTVLVQCNESHCLLNTANIGDSKAVLRFANGSLLVLTYDHNGRDAQETKRIQEAGGAVSFGRVHGTLAVTRAFGDTFFDKEKEVISKPFFSSTVVRRGEGSLLLLASDGLWDAFSSVEELFESLSFEYPYLSTQDLADKLVEEAMVHGNGDNISVIVVHL